MPDTSPTFFARLARQLMAGATAFFALAGAAMAETVALEVAEARAGMDSTSGAPALHIELSAAGRKAFGDFTIRNVGTQIDVLLDGKVLTSPYIQSPITGGSLMINGNFTAEEIEAMVARIRAGEGALVVRLPAP